VPRVRHINQFREKWGASRPKMHPSSRGFADAVASSRRGGSKKYSATLRSEGERDKGLDNTHAGDRLRLHRALTASDLERYRSIALWLSGSGIDIPDAPQAQVAARPGGTDMFDDVLDSLDALEKSVEDELALISGRSANESAAAGGMDSSAAQVLRSTYEHLRGSLSPSQLWHADGVDRATDLRLRRRRRARHRRCRRQKLLEPAGKCVRSDGRVRVPSALPVQRGEHRELLLPPRDRCRARQVWVGD
jgi:hypothetical protein